MCNRQYLLFVTIVVYSGTIKVVYIYTPIFTYSIILVRSCDNQRTNKTDATINARNRHTSAVSATRNPTTSENPCLYRRQSIIQIVVGTIYTPLDIWSNRGETGTKREVGERETKKKAGMYIYDYMRHKKYKK